MKRNESRYIPLNKLKKSPRNVRQVPHSKQHVEALATSIQTHGPLQDPVVETERDDDGQPTGCYFVTVGEGRRLAHLARVKHKWIKCDHPIRCTVDDEHNPLALSLAENVLRESMHPADQFVAFKALVDSGQSVEDIAAQYSVTPLVVQRRLKLANVAPEFLAMYREGKGGLTLEHLMALAVVDDHQRQQEVWKELPECGRSPDALRSALTQDEVPMSDPVARFVTRKVYERAGGAVRRDLFADDGDVHLVDRAMLEQLAREKLEKHAAKLSAEGVAWVEVALRMDYAKRATYGYVRTVRREPTEQESQALAAARSRLDEIENQVGSVEDEAKLSELDDAAASAQEEIDQMEEALEVPDPQQQAVSGAIVTIGRDGKVEIERGRLKPHDVNRFRRATNTAAQPQAAGPRTHSVSMTRRLTAYRTLALQASLAQQPQVALLALTHRLVLKELYEPGTGVRSSLQLRIEPMPLRQDAPDLEQARAYAVLQAQREKLRAQLPEASALFDWLRAQATETLLELLAFSVAQSVNGVQSDDGPSAFDQLAMAAQLDMREWWTPTADGYFNSLPKADILKIVRDAASPEAAKPLELLKKMSLAKSAEEKSSAQAGFRPCCALTRPRAAPVWTQSTLLCVHSHRERDRGWDYLRAPVYRAVLAVNRAALGLSRHKRLPPREDAGPLHLFHVPRSVDDCCARRDQPPAGNPALADSKERCHEQHHRQATRAHSRALTDAQVADVLAWHRNHKTLVHVAREHGVREEPIRNVLRRGGVYKQASPELRACALEARRELIKSWDGPLLQRKRRASVTNQCTSA